MSKPRILLYDIETLPNIVYTWPGLYEVNVVKVIKDGELASVAYKWLGEKQVHCITRQGQKTDKQLVQKFSKVLGQADISVAHNGNAFDNKTVNVRILKHGLTPPAPRKYIDTKTEAKKHFKFNGNSLSELARFLDLGSKVKHTGFDLWEGCIADDPKAWALMIKYNKMDVVLLEEVLNKFQPWIKLSVVSTATKAVGKVEVCPAVGCKSTKFASHGLRFAGTGSYRRLQCLSCGHWVRQAVRPNRPLKSL
jgi:hypothetical protein